MALNKTERRSQGQLQHQRHAHGGRDAGAADHLHGDHAHVAKGVSVDMAKVNNPERCRTRTKKMRCWCRSCATAQSTSGPTSFRPTS